MTREVVDNYFDFLKVTLVQNTLINSPWKLFNCDETLPLNISCGKVVTRKNTKHVYAQSRGKSEHIVLLLCASAPVSSAATYENFPGSLRNLLVMKVQFILRVSLVGSISVDEGVSQVLWLTTSRNFVRC